MTYLKNNTLQEVHAGMFDMKQDMCNKLIHILHPIVCKCLEEFRPIDNTEVLNEKAKNGGYLAADCTERRVQRDSHCQEDYYSGKKKIHALKNFLIVNVMTLVVFLSSSKPAPVHDKKMAEEAKIILPPGIIIGLDSGFQGLDIAGGATIEMPKKKPKNKDLTDDEKKANTLKASKRVIVENTIAHCKVLRTAKDVLRWHKDERKDLLFATAVRLHNFKVCRKRNIKPPLITNNLANYS